MLAWGIFCLEIIHILRQQKGGWGWPNGDVSHGHHTMVDGANFWISCQQLKLIQNLAPSAMVCINPNRKMLLSVDNVGGWGSIRPKTWYMDGPLLYAYLHLCMLNSPYRHSTLFVMLNLPMICKHEFVNPFFIIEFL